MLRRGRPCRSRARMRRCCAMPAQAAFEGLDAAVNARPNKKLHKRCRNGCWSLARCFSRVCRRRRPWRCWTRTTCCGRRTQPVYILYIYTIYTTIYIYIYTTTLYIYNTIYLLYYILTILCCAAAQVAFEVLDEDDAPREACWRYETREATENRSSYSVCDTGAGGLRGARRGRRAAGGGGRHRGPPLAGRPGPARPSARGRDSLVSCQNKLIMFILHLLYEKLSY